MIRGIHHVAVSTPNLERIVAFYRDVMGAEQVYEGGWEEGSDIIDQIVAGVRSSCTYAGAADIAQFQERAVVGVQGSAGYEEGRPQGTSW